MLEPYKRGKLWWVKGRIEYNGRAISDYYRCSTGAATRAGAQDWIGEEQDRRIRAFLIGEEAAERPLTFADAVTMYTADPKTAGYLIPITERLGSTPVNDLTPEQVHALARELYPDSSTDTWQRQVITPTRSVINKLHHRDRRRCNPIRIRNFTTKEREEQDKRRGRKSRLPKTPGSWPWLLKFCAHASERHQALALTMYVTGARIGQTVAMKPEHLDLDNARICIPGAKGVGDRWLVIPDYLVAKLQAISPKVPRGWERCKANVRVFGWADRGGPRKGWDAAERAAGIPHLSFHAAGRHGFGQEMYVRQGVDAEAAKLYGGWSKGSRVFGEVYVHPEDSDAKILAANRTGLVHENDEYARNLLSAKGKA